MKLTISMSTYDDYDGVFFTIQSLRMHHRLPSDTEFLVIDNNPDGGHSKTLNHFLKGVPNSRVADVRDRKSSFVKYDAFDLATGDVMLGLDCHVLLKTGFIDQLLHWWSENRGSPSLLTGPLIYNDLVSKSTHMNEEWRGTDFGTWGTNAENLKTEKPFPIPMQGMGCFSFWREKAPRPNPGFRHFGAEEWYMAERTRRNGGKVICHPSLEWMHRFDWPPRNFPMSLEEKVVNYYRGWFELYDTLEHQRMQEMTTFWQVNHPKLQLDALIERAKIPPL